MGLALKKPLLREAIGGIAPDRGGAGEDAIARIAALEEALRVRDCLLATAAHELRNPMFALDLHLGLALARARRGGDRALAQSLERTMMALIRYMDRSTTLLEVARLNAGARSLPHEDIDLAAVVRQVADDHRAEAAHTRATLRVDVPQTLVLSWDRAAAEQVVGNLVSNAIRFGAGGPVDVRLSRGGRDACLSVRDHGPGIGAEERERILGRFEPSLPTSGRPGFGIGLWLVRSLLDAHGGRISLESTPGAGATFLVRLPLDATPTEQREP